MEIDNLKNNLRESEKILADLKKLERSARVSDKREREFIYQSMNSLVLRLRMLNNAIAPMVDGISAAKKLDDGASVEKKQGVVSVSYVSPMKNERSTISLKKEDKTRFLKELSLTEDSLKRTQVGNALIDEKKSSKLAIISNKVFGGFSERISMSNFQGLKKDLREANFRFLLPTFISIAMFVSLVLFLFSLVFIFIWGIFNSTAWLFLWVPFLILIISGVFFYLYPSLKKSYVGQGINAELPFATIYMAAIAGSNIDPVKIFKIISDSSEYKYVGFEMKKIINQIEIYGYDLVNSLKNVAKSTVSFRLAELLNGMATNIATGSSLKNFLEKKSENLLMDYRMEREKYNSVATTFMDVYISVLITAPLIMVMLIVIMNLTDLNLGGLSMETLVGISIGIVVFLNVCFLIFLQIKQPKV